jgi:hypothetical protein
MTEVIGLPNNSYKPITNKAWVRARLYKLQKGCTRLTTASVKAYHGRWFSPGTPASFTTKTSGRSISSLSYIVIQLYMLCCWFIDFFEVFNATFSNISAISWQLVYDKEEIERPWNNRAYEILCCRIISIFELTKLPWCRGTPGQTLVSGDPRPMAFYSTK